MDTIAPPINEVAKAANEVWYEITDMASCLLPYFVKFLHKVIEPANEVFNGLL